MSQRVAPILLFITLVMVSGVAPVYAAIPLDPARLDSQSLFSSLEMRQLNTSNVSPVDLATADFAPIDINEKLRIQVIDQPIALKVDVVNRRQGSDTFAIQFGNSKAGRIDAYLIENGVTTWQGSTGPMVPAAERQIHARYPVFIVPVTEVPATLVFVLSSGWIDRFSISPIAVYNHDSAETATLQSALLALLLAMSIYWGIIFVATRDGHYGVYILHLLSYAAYTIFYDGYLLFYSEATYSPYFLRAAGEITLWCTIIFLLEFVRRFVDAPDHHPTANRLMLGLITGCVLMSPLSLTAEGIDVLQQLTLLMVISVLFILLLYLAVNRNRAAFYFLLSFVPAAIGVAMAQVIYLFPGLFDHNPGSGYFYYIGSSLQMVLLAFGFAAMVNRQRSEREDARQEAFLQLQESSRLKDNYSKDLEREIAEQTKILQVQAEKVERLSDLKSRFFAAASHDLRQPLHAMGLFSVTLKNHVPGREGQDLLDKLNRSLQSMTDLFNSLLDVSRLDAGAVEPDYSTVSVATLLNDLASEFKLQARMKGLRFSIRTADLFINTDAALLTRVLRNLLSNAIRYTEAGGILLSARQRNGKVIIQVWDTGVGMNDQQLANAFDEFVQVQGTSKGGLGLGLSVVKRTTELLNHELTVNSRVGHGTTFTIAADMVEASTSAPTVNQHLGTIGHLSVWVVDDDDMVLSAMQELLQSWGCTTTCYAQPADVLSDAEHELPGLLISDADLGGGLDGFDLIQQLSRKGTFQAAIITGDTSKERLNFAREQQVPLLHKPVNPAQLRSLVLFASRKKVTESQAAL